jgi:sugar lactone lactonase YvrE
LQTLYLDHENVVAGKIHGQKHDLELMTIAKAITIVAGGLLFASILKAQTPPTILSETTNVLAHAGATATLTVEAGDTASLSYQWYFNGSPIIINGTIVTAAGGVGDGGPATNALLFSHTCIKDQSGNLFIADTFNCCVRHVGTNGIIRSVAGNGNQGYAGDGGAATNAELNNPNGVAVDGFGRLYIADSANNCIRKVDTNGLITTVAGNGSGGNSGDGGPAASAELSLPYSVALNGAGCLFVSDELNQCIRKIDTNGEITTFAGNGIPGYQGDGGAATNAEFHYPTGLALDTAGDLLIADSLNNCIRMVDTNGIITTVAGDGTAGYTGDGKAATNAELGIPIGVAVDATGSLLIDGSDNNCIRKVAGNGIITSLVTNAGLSAPTDVASDPSGNLYIDDYNKYRILELATNGLLTTVAGSGNTSQEHGFRIFAGDAGPATSARLNGPNDVVLGAAGDLIIADTANNRIRKVDTNGIILTVAGNGIANFAGDGGAATDSELNNPTGVAVDPAGNLFIADFSNQRIRKVDINGIITTVAGNGVFGFKGDGGAATNAELGNPTGVAVDGADNLFIADAANERIRKVDTNGIIWTVAGNGNSAYGGDGGLATNAELNNPGSVAVDAAGNFFIADTVNARIREVDTNGVIWTVAGNGNNAYGGDGGAATNAELNYPNGVAVDNAENLLIADSQNSRIREIWTNGTVTTVAGKGTGAYAGSAAGDGGAATNALLLYPSAVAVDGNNNLFIADTGYGEIREVRSSNLSLADGGASLVIADDGSQNAGTYDVLIYNAFGSVTSSVLNLAITQVVPEFTDITLTNGFVMLRYRGAPTNNYVVWSTCNLSPPINWTALATNTSDNFVNTIFWDTNIVSQKSKFYRVASLP